jgi:hypothetical protein
METIGIRIESGPELAWAVIVLLVVLPIVAASIRARWLRARGRDAEGVFWPTLAIALGIELGLFGALALSVSGSTRKYELVLWFLVVPVAIGLVRAWKRPGERLAVFSRSSLAALGIMLAPFALISLLVGAACFGSSGYVEF